MRPPVIFFMWMALRFVVGHSVGKKGETSWRAAVVVRRTGVGVLSFDMVSMWCVAFHFARNIDSQHLTKLASFSPILIL